MLLCGDSYLRRASVAQYLPYLLFLACPISMGLMMWMMMGRNHNQMSASGPDPRMAELESQVNELRVALQDPERRAGATLRESGSSLK